MAVTGSERSPELPNVPSMAEAGYPEVNSQLWSGFFVPAGTPDAIVSKLTAELGKALADAGVRESLAKMAVKPGGPTGDAFKKYIEADIKAYADVVEAAKLTCSVSTNAGHSPKSTVKAALSIAVTLAAAILGSGDALSSRWDCGTMRIAAVLWVTILLALPAAAATDPAIDPLPEPPTATVEAIATEAGVVDLLRAFKLFGTFAADCGRPAAPGNPHVSVTQESPDLVIETHFVGDQYAANHYSVRSARRLAANRLEIKVVFVPGTQAEQFQTLELLSARARGGRCLTASMTARFASDAASRSPMATRRRC